MFLETHILPYVQPWASRVLGFRSSAALDSQMFKPDKTQGLAVLTASPTIVRRRFSGKRVLMHVWLARAYLGSRLAMLQHPDKVLASYLHSFLDRKRCSALGRP